MIFSDKIGILIKFVPNKMSLEINYCQLSSKSSKDKNVTTFQLSEKFHILQTRRWRTLRITIRLLTMLGMNLKHIRLQDLQDFQQWLYICTNSKYTILYQWNWSTDACWVRVDLSVQGGGVVINIKIVIDNSFGYSVVYSFFYKSVNNGQSSGVNAPTIFLRDTGVLANC